MTSLRDLFKKTKESTNKVLDADIEKNVEKTAKASWHFIKTFFLLVLICIPIAIFSVIIYWMAYQPYWCKKTFENTVQYEGQLKRMSINTRGDLYEKWFNYHCYSEFDVSSENLDEYEYWQDYFEKARN
jgi:hypothetical protein